MGLPAPNSGAAICPFFAPCGAVVAAITGRRSSTHSFTRRPLIAATIQTEAASENPGGFFGAGES
jgi:hypothetical protein